jgi:two-component system sensor histidine kinase DegS
MKDDPYTPKFMEAARTGTQSGDSRFDGLRAEATAAVGYSANALRAVRDGYREVYAETLARWQALRDELDTIERTPNEVHRDRRAGKRTSRDSSVEAVEAAEAGATDARTRAARAEVDALTDELGARQAELAKLELAAQTMERTWLFLERGDATLVTDASGPQTHDELSMRIVEAQEAERSRLAQEIHDGPAQALTNAIFQVEYIERVLSTDTRLAESELRFLRDLLRRELGDIRAFISQLRPPLLDELGLDGAIDDTVDHFRTLTAITITTSLGAPPAALTDAARTVVLRVTQEALQNVRKHASATNASVTTRIEGGDWTLEVTDDGRGFDVGAVAARGRRNFGLQFMRERAELIGARLDVRSRPDGGTVVRLVIPTDAVQGEEEHL